MNQSKADKLLTILYSGTAIFALVSSVSSGIVWDHWKLTLNQYCRTMNDERRNCSCILYGESNPTHFIGGSLSSCAWIYFGPVPIILGVISLAIYHGIRACFGSTEEATKTVTTKNESGETIIMRIRTTDAKPVSRVFFIIASTITVVFTIYMLVHFSTFAQGYLHTCNQYRKELIKLLNISGTAVAVIHSRLSCNAVYDFMDYLQPISGEILRDNFINTAAGLLSGLICSFLAFVSLFVAMIINIKFAKGS